MLVPAVGFGAVCTWLNGSAQCKYHDVVDKKRAKTKHKADQAQRTSVR
jgi:hypothetical protein